MTKHKQNDDRPRLEAEYSSYNATDQHAQTINRRKMTDAENSDNPFSTKIEQKRNRQKLPAPIAFKYLTSVSHACAISISAFIIYLCFKTDFEFFTWHPFLFAIGWMSIMTEGVLILTKSNFMADRISHTWRIRLHWILQSVAITCTVVGFTIVVVNKNLKNKQHWKSWHGLIGLISVICAIVPTCITGVPALFHRELRDYVSSKLNQLVHSIFGIASLILGGVTMMLSLYTNWFARRTGGDTTIFTVCWVVMCVPLLWLLFHPAQKAIERTKGLLQKSNV